MTDDGLIPSDVSIYAECRYRCKALLSVDDAYAGILDALDDLKVADKTYVLVTSDHGYNLGQHMLPSNKFLNYEV